MTVITESIFKALSSINIENETKEKNHKKYLPWSSAWYHIKSVAPEATYSVVKDDNSKIYHTDGLTCWVETVITAGGITQNETLPVMDNRNQSIPLDKITSTAINKSIKRCLVKNAALFGLGLSLWNGEELSEDAKKQKAKKVAESDVLKSKVIAKAKSLINKGVDSKELYSVIKKIAGTENPNKINDNEILKLVDERLNVWEVKK